MVMPRLASLLIAAFVLCAPPVFAEDSAAADTQTSSDEWGDNDWGEEEEDKHSPISGFIEVAYGARTQSNPWVDRNDTLNEARLRLEYSDYFGQVYVGYKGDFTVDDLTWDGSFIETKTREALLRFSPSENSDLYLGRQVLTWGTGDRVFLNDLFPKDWVSFFAGREMEYLKAPSDALKFSYFNQLANIDLVWTPKFDPDTFIRG